MEDNYIEFKNKHSFEFRSKESDRIRKKFPNRIPIIVEKCGSKSDIPYIDKNKYLTPSDLTVGQFIYVIRKRLKLSPEIGLFFFINDKMYPVSEILSKVFNEAKDEDGFLYIKYSGENTFG